MEFKVKEYAAELVDPILYTSAINIVETAARTCYQSTPSESLSDKIKFIKGLIKRGHESVLEHVNFTVRALVDRGILAEWTRHRIGSAYSVESTRYVNYTTKEFAIVLPKSMPTEDKRILIERSGIEQVIDGYTRLVQDYGMKPEMARAVLPQCLAVHMTVTHNIRQWRHIFKQRLFNNAAHPGIREVMSCCFDILCGHAPCFFEDLREEDLNM